MMHFIYKWRKKWRFPTFGSFSRPIGMPDAALTPLSSCSAVKIPHSANLTIHCIQPLMPASGQRLRSEG